MKQELIDEMNSIRWWHRIELEKNFFSPGEVMHGPDGSNFEETRFGISHDLTGKTVLDIGAWDGGFSFACEKRNALKVVASDKLHGVRNWGGNKGFNFAKKVLNSKVEFIEADVMDDMTHLGMFDITLQFGVLYHLQSMLPALHNTFAITKEFTLLETAVIPPEQDRPEFPYAAFLQGTAGDPTNFWYPNYKCLERMLLYVGYKKVEQVFSGYNRVTVKAYK